MKLLGNVVVALAVFFAIVTATSWIVVDAELDRRVEVSDRRGPEYKSTADGAELAWSIDGASIGGRPVSVMYYAPKDPQTPVPPGVSKWMGPGETAVSPGLITHTDFIERQFGPIAAVIDPGELLGPDELVVYVRPLRDQELWDRALAEERAYLASGFGSQDGAVPFGDSLYENNAGNLPYLLVVTLLPPTLIFILLARRLVHQFAAREQYVLQALGARRSTLSRYLITAVKWGLLTGTAVALLLQILIVSFDVALPFANFTLHHSAIARSTNELLVVDFVVLAMLSILFFSPRTGLKTAGKKSTRGLGNSSGLVVFTVGLVLVTAGTLSVLYTDNNMEMYLWFLGIILTCLGLPAALTQLTYQIGSRFPPVSASNIILGWMKPNAKRISFPSALAGSFIIIGCVLAVLYVSSNSFPRSGIEEQAENSISTTQVSCRGDDTACLTMLMEDISKSVPEAYVFALLDSSNSNYVVELPQTLENRTQLDGVLSLFVADVLSGRSQRGIENAHFSRGIIYSVNPTGNTDLAQLQMLRADGTERIPISQWLGQDDTAVSNLYGLQSRWIVWMLGISFIIVLSTTTVTGALVARNEAEEMGPIAALTASTATLTRALALRALVVTTIATVSTMLVAVVISMQVAASLSITIPFAFLMSVSALLVGAYAVQAGISVLAVKKASATWTPGKENLE